MGEIQAEVSESFVVGGYIEAESLQKVPQESDGQPLFADPMIAPFVTCGNTPPVGNASAVSGMLKVADLNAKQLDGTGVAVAIMDTGINLAHLSARLPGVRIDAMNSWTPAGSTTLPGKHSVHHGTMCAYDVLVAAPNATLLDFPVLGVDAPGGAAMSGTLGTALQAFAYLVANWAVAFAPGGTAKYNALVVNNSWGMFHPSWDFPLGHPGRYCDNPNHPFNMLVTALARSGADILFAAGNCGSQCPDNRCQGRVTETIMGANAHPDVLTIAGCDTRNNRVGYSSQGPSIAAMPQKKPDLTAYTHFLGSEAFGSGTPDSGTSAACPIAAGCVAALRTRLPPQTTPPVNLFSQLRSTALPVPQIGWNADYGHGIIDPLAAAQSLGL